MPKTRISLVKDESAMVWKTKEWLMLAMKEGKLPARREEKLIEGAVDVIVSEAEPPFAGSPNFS